MAAQRGKDQNLQTVNVDTLTDGLRAIRRVVLSLGSNLGDRGTNLQGGVDSLTDTPDVSVVAVSGVYETDPVGAPDGSPEFFNIVVLADTTLSAATLMERCLAIEDAYGRKRSVPNSPRTLDVDLVAYADRSIEEPEVTVPHPRAHERAFVLVPWLELDPDAEIPGRGRVADLVAGIDTAGVRRLDEVTVESS